MDKNKVLKVASVVLIAAGVGCAYFGGVAESGVVAVVGVAFGVIAAVAALLK